VTPVPAPGSRDPGRPAHPMRASILLVVGVALLIVVLATASTLS